MLGMSLVVPTTAPAVDETTAPAVDETPAPAQAVPAATHRTMLGMPQVDLAAAQGARQADGAAADKPGDPLGPTHRTMLGMAARSVPNEGQPSSDGHAAALATPSDQPRRRAQVHFGDASDVPVNARGKSRAVVVFGIIAILFLVVVGGGLGAYLILSGEEESVRASIVPTDSGDALRVEVTGAASDARVRFGGQEIELQDGVGSFSLAADTLSIGDNHLTVEVVDSGGARPHEVTLVVSYRIRADVTPLSEDPPALAVLVDAIPGSDVTLGGEAIALDSEGHGSRRFPTPTEAAAPVFEHRAEYRVALPDGQMHTGTVQTRVPYATLMIDRPGHAVVTDSETVEIAGAVHQSGTVTIDGAAVETTDGRFLSTHAIGGVGQHEVRVVARQPGRAPRAIVLSIRRVDDLAVEAASFAPEPGLTYARLAQNPTIYRSQRIALEGRIYNINVANGQSVLQMLVRDCPRGERCPLWVTYGQATDATINDWVRVLGTVAGEQQFRSESDRVITVPRVDAQFVLPTQAR
jgi:hypothetical protein